MRGSRLEWLLLAGRQAAAMQPARPPGSPAAGHPAASIPAAGSSAASIPAAGSSAAGFTLLEILVVLVILGLLAAVIAGPQIFRQLGAAKSEAAKLQIERVGGALDLYRLDIGRYPNQQEGLRALMEQPLGAARWNGPYLKKQESLVDPWGRPFGYRYPGQRGEYDLWSLGADGTEGGDGENRDVVSW